MFVSITDKIKKDHKRKSDQVKELRKSLKNKTKNTIPLAKLKDMLAKTKRYEVDARDYDGLNHFDDAGFDRADAKRDARIELLEEIIRYATISR